MPQQHSVLANAYIPYSFSLLKYVIMKYLENTRFLNCSKFPVTILKNKIEITSLRMRLLKFSVEKLQNIETKQSRKLQWNIPSEQYSQGLYPPEEGYREKQTGTCNPHFTAKHFCKSTQLCRMYLKEVRISKKKVERQASLYKEKVN